mgnify:CR=1 FL=1
MDQTLIELETRLAFQEDLLQALSQQLYKQDVRLQDLERRNQALTSHVRDLAGNQADGTADDAPPPHY